LNRRRLRRALVAAILLVAITAGTVAAIHIERRRIQWHDDPDVASAWVVGITHGPHLSLSRGGPLLHWLSDHSIKALGTPETLTSRFDGDPDGIEIWFAYKSHLKNHRQLECHRVGRTAFIDDLGQSYHGFLDFSGDYIGVYVPAYDRAARCLTCTLHWMARDSPLHEPVSRPMRFEIELPPVPRVLPPAERLAFGPITQTHQGVRVTLGNVHLGSPTFGSYEARQRDLTFHLGVQGGTLAASNIDPYRAEMAARDSIAPGTGIALPHTPPIPWNRAPAPGNPLTISDPYGHALVPARGEIVPMMSLDELHCTRANDGIVWIAPVNGAGRGTDAVRVRFDVRPTAGGAPVPFDLTVRVHGDQEL
jgi:hypothetical protein